MLKRIFDIEKKEVVGETGLFIEDDSVRLLFPVEKVLRVYNSNLGVEYAEGRDYKWIPGESRLLRTEGSAIPKMGAGWLHPDPATARLYPDPKADAIGTSVSDGGLVPFDNRDFFARHQFEIDYVATGLSGITHGSFLQGRLPRLAEALKAGKNLRMNSLGDSITEGYNASKYENVPPFQPSYQFLVAEGLEERFGNKVEMINHGVSGTVSNHPLEHIPNWIDDKPDVTIIAFGMNDSTFMPIDEYIGNISAIMEKAHAACADTEFVLVASMPGNVNWKPLEHANLTGFSAALRKYAEGAGEHVTFVDQFEWIGWFLSRKGYYDLTGNGVNHPNDFMHRALAMNILQAIDPEGNWR